MQTLICGNGVDMLLFQSNGSYKVFFLWDFFLSIIKMHQMGA
jgi:hypothetical protein